MGRDQGGGAVDLNISQGIPTAENGEEVKIAGFSHSRTRDFERSVPFMIARRKVHKSSVVE
jgi:hypothetical protein